MATILNTNEYFKNQIMLCVQIIEELEGCEIKDLDNGLDSRVDAAMFSEDRNLIRTTYQELAKYVDQLRGD